MHAQPQPSLPPAVQPQPLPLQPQPQPQPSLAPAVQPQPPLQPQPQPHRLHMGCSMGWKPSTTGPAGLKSCLIQQPEPMLHPQHPHRSQCSRRSPRSQRSRSPRSLHSPFLLLSPRRQREPETSDSHSSSKTNLSWSSSKSARAHWRSFIYILISILLFLTLFDDTGGAKWRPLQYILCRAARRVRQKYERRDKRRERYEGDQRSWTAMNFL